MSDNEQQSVEKAVASHGAFLSWATYKPWIWELLSLLGGLVALATMVALLARFNGASPFEWNGITLNTIISILSVTLKALILSAIVECVGQWKWILSSLGERSLSEFERIDLASRGIFGCFYVAGNLETPWVLRLGVFLTLLSAALDPFSQQLIRIKQEVQYFPSPEFGNSTNQAIAGRSISCQSGKYDYWTDDIGPDFEESERVYKTIPETSLTMEWAVSSGLSGLNNSSPAVCPSANCTWPSYNTIGVCSQCNDVSSKLKKVDGFLKVLETMAEHPDWLLSEDGASAWALPNGHFLANMNNGTAIWPADLVGTHDQIYSMTAFGTGDPGKTVTMQGLDTMIWSTSVIQLDPNQETQSSFWQDKSIIATECAIYYCVKRVETSIQNNVVNETVSELTDAVLTPNSFEPKSKESFNWGKYPATKKTPNGRPSMEWNETLATAWQGDASFYFPDNHTDLYSVSPFTVATVGSFIQSKLELNITQLAKARTEINKVLGDDAVGFNGFYGPMAIEGQGRGGQRVAPKWLKNFVPDGKNNVREGFELLAESITNEFRQAGQDSAEKGMRFGDARVLGSVASLIIFYQVSWPWISLHATILASGMLFCLLTVWASRLGKGSRREPPVWKTNSLAVLKQGSSTGQVFKDAWDLNQMAEVARAGHKIGIPWEEELPLLDREDRRASK